jgi:hypothetical protein
MIARVTITKPARWLRREQKEPPNDARNEPCGSSAFLLYGLPLGQSSNHHGHAKDGVPERIPLGVAFGSLSVIERMEKLLAIASQAIFAVGTQQTAAIERSV